MVFYAGVVPNVFSSISWLINYHPHSGWYDEGPSRGPPVR